jgi:DNA mismatch repair protein MutL
MPRIRQLPTSVITKIAAGEVIERPASVVKELLENSVDAGSRRIDVEVEQGGAELIRVVDDGCGIPADELALAFASHATSKLVDADDLFRIGTLGFRGEALASIGGVAQVTLQSRPAGQSCGAEISCQGGTLGNVRPWNGAEGTRIEARHLFYNTPVRRKFLRTTGTEIGHICEVFTRLALSHPGLHLTLRHQGKDVYEVPASAGLLDRIILFFGAELRDLLYEVKVQQGPATLTGFIADPSCERGNAKMQYLFVNGRWIRDRSLGHALMEAYRGLLMTGRYAVAFLFVDLPPDQVDVNVHPTKTEVRFRDGHALYSMVFGALRNRLNAAHLTPRLHATSTLAGAQVVGMGGGTTGLPPSRGGSFLPEVQFAPRPAIPPPAAHHPGNGAPPTLPSSPGPAAPPPPAAARDGAGGDVPVTEPVAAPQPDTAGFKAIQLYDAYLVVETPEGMLVIDQHALHESILFEQLKCRLRNGPLEAQRLLIPEPVDLSAEQAAHTLEHRDALAQLGLGVEDFGGGTILLTSYPAILGNRSPEHVLKAVVDHLGSKEKVPSREALFNDLLSLMACHSAVRSGDRLSPEEISSLVAQRELADHTHHCPHGRPTALLFSKHDLDRQFRRV